jgi:flagellum-specific peptidoglycan hydrolase FlgJ
MDENERSKRFPQPVVLAAQHSERESKVPTCLTLAQYAVESDYGSRIIGRGNALGIKWRRDCGFPPVSVTTHEFIQGVRTALQDLFIDFPDIESCFEYHGKLLTNPNGPYAECLPVIADWRQYAVGISHIYATDVNYAKMILDTIAEWELAGWNLATSPEPLEGPSNSSQVT